MGALRCLYSVRTCKVKCFGSVGGLRHVEAREKMFFSRTFNEVVLGFLPEKGTPELHVKTRESLWLYSINTYKYRRLHQHSQNPTQDISARFRHYWCGP